MNVAAQLLVLTDKIMNYRGNTALFLLRYYCGNTALFLPLPRGYRNFFTIPTVLPWNFSHLPRYYRGYRGITAFPITVSLSILSVSLPTHPHPKRAVSYRRSRPKYLHFNYVYYSMKFTRLTNQNKCMYINIVVCSRIKYISILRVCIWA